MTIHTTTLPLQFFPLPFSPHPKKMPTAGDRNPFLLLFILLLVTARCIQSQPLPNTNGNNNNSDYNQYNVNFNPSMAIVIVVLISAFFFLGFFSIYVRQCAGDTAAGSIRGASAAAAGRSIRQRGLDEETLESFPTLVYSEVKGLKIGKGALECAVCLSEFEDDETLRLLPKCDHVFHPDCIDAWLSAHVTCPVCRSNLAEAAETPEVQEVRPEASEEMQTPPSPAAMMAEHAVTIEPPTEEEEEVRRQEQANLERIINMKRAKSRARPVKFPRSHSTGHSLVQPGENLDRFTLRLPEGVRRGIMDTAEVSNLKRAKSMVGEGSSRRGYRVGEGSTGGAVRSIRLGRSETWQTMLIRTLSTKMTGWGRRAEPESSTKRGKSVGSTTAAA